MAEFDPHIHCGADRKGKAPCTQRKGWGTKHPGIGRCKLHGGATPNHERAAEFELARREADRLGIPVEVDPGQALLGLLWESYGNVEFYRQLVQALPTHPEPDRYVSAQEVLEERAELQAQGIDPPPIDDDKELEGHWQRGTPGVYGPTYHVSGLPTGEAKRHILVQLYDEERDRAAGLAATALKLGIEERRIRLVEQDAARIFQAQIQALKAIGLGDKIDDFRNAFATALRPHVREPLALGHAAAG